MATKVLVVDDEPDVATYMSVVLKQNGFTPVLATSADQALDLVKSECPDLICLDIMMPKRSGFSFYTALREDEECSGIPVVVVSGVVQQGEFDFRQFVPDRSIPPPQYYVEKPIEVEPFVALLRKLARRKARRAEPKGGK
jgi:CheY-like chemotaxis protein